MSENEQRYRLPRYATIAPIGHLRIKEAVASINMPTANVTRLFEMNEVVNRHADFLDYANQMGAIAGGATGADGESPKLVLRLTPDGKGWGDKVWIDHQQLGIDSSNQMDDYYLVKFPRGSRNPIDCDILRAEFHYYQELTEMGFFTIAIQGMLLIVGERYPSLWLPRFDIIYNENDVQRLAMESVYAILKQLPATRLNHGQVIRGLIKRIEQSTMVVNGFMIDRQQFVIDWVQRDLLNIAFGNSDNHGRNIAFLRNDTKIWLAPIFDFAPMKADPDGIPRSIVWQPIDGKMLESGGEYDFVAISESLADLVEPQILMTELRQTAEQLLDLPKRLKIRSVSDKILTHPATGFAYLQERLKRWGLVK